MVSHTISTHARRRPARAASRATLAGLTAASALVAAAILPSSALAAKIVFGSPLSVPATLNTAENLAYQGTNTEVPISPQAPNGIFHTFHFGADTALWNATTGRHSSAQTAGLHSASAPQAGQVVQIQLEGCAKPAAGGPSPLTQIHFQDLSPLPGGGATVNLTSQAFEIPVCGQEGASGSTVSTYEPTNLCVNQGDYVAFNDEGGYVENVYRAGVPYEVLGSIRGAEADSFIRSDGTGDGSVLSASDTAAMEGFAANQNEELMMQLVLGTGPNARYVCPGGSKEAPPVLPEIHVRPQTDGINHSRIIEVAIYCRPASGCSGTGTLTSAGRAVGTAQINLPGDSTGHVPVRVSSTLMNAIRKHHGVAATFTVVIGGQTFAQTIDIKIL